MKPKKIEETNVSPIRCFGIRYSKAQFNIYLCERKGKGTMRGKGQGSLGSRLQESERNYA